MKSDYPIPNIMKDLTLDERGYPIPYFVPIVNGKPEFRYQDGKKRQICIDRKLCSVCGKKLYDKSYWFISGPMGLMNKVHSDAPMHEDCARYSINVCPHLILLKAERRSEPGDDPNQSRVKPEVLFLVKADKTGLTYWQDKTYITFRPVYTEEYRYENNRLYKLEKVAP